MKIQSLVMAVTLVISIAASAEADKKVSKKQTKPVAAAKATKPKPTPKPTQLDMLKGEWTACRLAINEAGEPLKVGGTYSFQDRYSQTAPLEYTAIVASASDKECKKITKESRTTFECDEMTPELLTCKTKKREERINKGKWKGTPMLDHAGVENHYTIKLAITQKDPETVSLAITSDESEETETFELKKAKK